MLRPLEVSRAGITCVAEEAFQEKGKGEVEMKPRHVKQPRRDFFRHIMPSMRAAGIEWGCLHPQRCYVTEGDFRLRPQSHDDLGRLVRKWKLSRQSNHERIMWVNLSLARGDVATGIQLHRWAVELGTGGRQPL